MTQLTFELTVKTNGKKRKKRGRTCHSSSVPSANMEPSPCNASNGTQKPTRLDPPCSVHIHSRRYRLTDADGVCHKYAIDGLVHAKIFEDDSPKYIKKVSFSQEKITKAEREETIITITK